VDWIGVRQQHREQRMTRFVDRRDALLRVADDHRAALGSISTLSLANSKSCMRTTFWL